MCELWALLAEHTAISIPACAQASETRCSGSGFGVKGIPRKNTLCLSCVHFGTREIQAKVLAKIKADQATPREDHPCKDEAQRGNVNP